MDVTRERYQSAQEEKKQLTLKVEELERLEILGSLVLLTFPFRPHGNRSPHLLIPQGSLITSCPMEREWQILAAHFTNTF